MNAPVAKGKRLTCPVCQDSSFFTLKQIKETGGRIDCANHVQWVTMVDLAELIEILGHTTSIHPDDFEEVEFETA